MTSIPTKPSKNGLEERLIDQIGGFDALDIEAITKSIFEGANPNHPAVVEHLVTRLNRKFPASESADSEKSALLTAMLDAGLDPNVRGAQDRTFCQELCANGCDRLVVQLLEKAMRDAHSGHEVAPIDLASSNGKLLHLSPMMAAASHLNTSTLQVIQDYFEQEIMPRSPGLARNHLWSSRGPAHHSRNALMAICGDDHKLRWLLDHPELDMRKHLEDRDDLGFSVLRIAVGLANSRCVSHLLSLGANVVSVDNEGVNVLEAAKKDMKFSHSPSGDVDKRRNIVALKAAFDAGRASRSIDDVMAQAKSRPSP